MRLLPAMMLLVCLIASGQAYSVLSFPDLTDYYWRIYDDRGFISWMTFNEDGTIGSYVNNATKYWTMKQNHLILISDVNKKPTCTFAFASKDGIGAWWAWGLFLGTGKPQGWKYYLQQSI